MRKSLVAPVVSLVVLPFALAIVGAQRSPSAPQSGGKAPTGKIDRFVGTYKLVAVEQRNAAGQAIPPAGGSAKRIGYIVYDAAGYMAVSIMPVGRQKYAGAQPTDAEVMNTMTGYTAYFGTFTV